MKKNRQRLQNAPVGLPASQQGAVLLVGVIMLIVITLLSIAAIQTTTLQARMAGNMADRNLAFQSAESGLSFFEADLKGGREFSGAGYYDHDGATNTFTLPANLAADNSWENVLSTYDNHTLFGALASPLGIVEKMPPRLPLSPGEPVMTDEFRVTTRGTGRGIDDEGSQAKSKVVLQTYFVRYR